MATYIETPNLNVVEKVVRISTWTKRMCFMSRHESKHLHVLHLGSPPLASQPDYASDNRLDVLDGCGVLRRRRRRSVADCRWITNAVPVTMEANYVPPLVSASSSSWYFGRPPSSQQFRGGDCSLWAAATLFCLLCGAVGAAGQAAASASSPWLAAPHLRVVRAEDATLTSAAGSDAGGVLLGVSVSSAESVLRSSSSGEPEISAQRITTLQLRGAGLNRIGRVVLTRERAAAGHSCRVEDTVTFQRVHTADNNGTLLQLSGELSRHTLAGEPLPSGVALFVCAGRRGDADVVAPVHLGSEFKFRYVDSGDGVVGPRVVGFRAYGSGRISVDEHTGLTEVPADTAITLQVFGSGFTNTTSMAFTTVSARRGVSCDNMPLARVVRFGAADVALLSPVVASLRTRLPAVALSSDERYYICVKHITATGESTGWVHQGSGDWLSIRSAGRLLPLWVQLSFILVLLVLSGLFSGLNLGLMALDKTELKVIESCGTPSERKCAKAIAPLRNHGNYLLCSLLLGNVLVNNTLTILLDDLTSGLVAILGSTIAIVVFGEIIPQAICSRHGLEVGARTLIITKIFMVLTFPASYPISRILDHVLGEEIGHVYDREKLIQYIRLTMDYTQLANEEVNIISGALELKTKHAGQIMTHIDDVFMLPYNTVLDFETVSSIIREGYTRIPVYDGNRDTIVALLNIKDLAFIDPADAFPLKTVCDFYRHPLTYCFEDQSLDELLDEFKKGKSHMSIVQAIHVADDADPTYTVVGIVTLEDVIEEILKIEIVDETDVLTDNRERKKRKEVQLSKQDFTDFAKTSATSVIPAPLALATFQFLSTAVEPFKREFVSENVLRRLMVQNIFIHIKADELVDDAKKYIYRVGKPSDYFALLLEGRAKVTHHTSANESLEYEAGPFSYFGVPAIFVTPTTSAAATAKASHSQVSEGGRQAATTASGSASQMSLASPASDSTGGQQQMHFQPAVLAERPFTPDYSVEAVSDLLYMRVHRSVYAAAFKTSRLDRSNRSTAINLETEWANVLNALNTTGGQARTSNCPSIPQHHHHQQQQQLPLPYGRQGHELGGFISPQRATAPSSQRGSFATPNNVPEDGALSNAADLEVAAGALITPASPIASTVCSAAVHANTSKRQHGTETGKWGEQNSYASSNSGTFGSVNGSCLVVPPSVGVPLSLVVESPTESEVNFNVAVSAREVSSLTASPHTDIKTISGSSSASNSARSEADIHSETGCTANPLKSSTLVAEQTPLLLTNASTGGCYQTSPSLGSYGAAEKRDEPPR